ncbi:GrpB-like predicted nucleotidyltransferase (UPF0157 family) [Rhodococcus sp. 27YEA15]|uniref:GrpB family protein n=1 Tax=Rhodococcus sp. 27YEA15 TaxID=3156259 RepID=UPI003C7B46E7
MPITVVAYSDEWPRQYDNVASSLREMLSQVSVVAVEHVGSTAVPGLAAKPILDIDVVVEREHVPAAIGALAAGGYVHVGDLGMADREAFRPPDVNPVRHVYVCVEGTLHVRNHLAVRSVLRSHPDLRDAYGAVKRELAEDPAMTIDRYIAGKSEILQAVLDRSELTTDDKATIRELNATSGR